MIFNEEAKNTFLDYIEYSHERIGPLTSQIELQKKLAPSFLSTDKFIHFLSENWLMFRISFLTHLGVWHQRTVVYLRGRNTIQSN